MKKSRVIFDSAAFSKKVYNRIAGEQTARLIAYAEEEIKKIGDTIRSYNSRHHMDNTGNLLDSLCWGVSFNGTLVKYGFYRQQRASYPAGLHSWYTVEWQRYRDNPDGTRNWYFEKLDTLSKKYNVWGHKNAEEYIARYGASDYRGWKVFFAILAPYWGYWEEGFTLVNGFSKGTARSDGIPYQGSTFMRFAVMSQYHDEISADLRPAKVTYKTSVPTYTSTQLAKNMAREFGGGRMKRKGN